MIEVLGMMSGTSLDGVDAALLETDGVRIQSFGASAYRPFSEPEADILRAALGHWPGSAEAARAAKLVEDAHAELAAQVSGARMIGFHGQTLAHDPGGRGTHQAGNGAALAARTGLPVVWDFRSEDVRQGGQGAPLAPFFHWACGRRAVEAGQAEAAPMAFLNLGGVGNLSLVDPRCDLPEAPGAALAFDTGPANAPINDLMRARRGAAVDAGGALALQGRADMARVERFLTHPYFSRQPPKSLDRDSFAGALPALDDLEDADALATLCAIAAGAVAAGLRHVPRPPAQVLLCGGGRHNAALVAALRAALPMPVLPVEQIGLNGDMLEAQAFAWLAARVWRGLPISGPSTTAAPHPICGGRISVPRGAGPIGAIELC